MPDREIASNFFVITNIKELKDGFYRVTLKNEYVLCEDTDLILNFYTEPKVGQRVIMKIEHLD